jgi:hypothetical protein
MREPNRRTFLKFSTGVGASFLTTFLTRAALVPPNFMFCVVALGGPVPEIQENMLVGYRWSAVGTGFFYGHLVKLLIPDDVAHQNEMMSPVVTE